MKQLIIFLFLLFPNIVFGQEKWIIDKNGCKFLKPANNKIGTFAWSGNCKDSLAEGIGQIVKTHSLLKSKIVFEGALIHGKAEGKGKYILSKRTKLEGIFKNGYFFEGTKTEKLGKTLNVYKGKFNENNLKGKGELVIVGAYRHIGEFEDDFENGYGKRYFDNGTIFIGNFKDGYIIYGKAIFKELGYEIESDDWKIHEPLTGTITYYEDSTKYEGELKKSLPHGIGTYTYNNGAVYEGEWKKDWMHGEGNYISVENIVYKAKWKKGLIQGKGLIIYPNGKINIGYWKKNKLIKEIKGT